MQLALNNSYIPNFFNYEREIGEAEADSRILIDEILLHIFSYLQNPAELERASLVCRRWCRIAKDHSLWKVILKKLCPEWEADKDQFQEAIRKLSKIPFNLSKPHLLESTIVLSNRKKIGVLTQKREASSFLYCAAQDHFNSLRLQYVAAIDMRSKTLSREFYTSQSEAIVYTAVIENRLIGIHSNGAVSIWNQQTGSQINLDITMTAPFASYKSITHQDNQFFVLTDKDLKIIDGTTFKVVQIVEANEIPNFQEYVKLEVYGNLCILSQPAIASKELNLFCLYNFKTRQYLPQPFEMNQFCFIVQEEQAYLISYIMNSDDFFYHVHFVDKELGILKEFSQVQVSLIPNERNTQNSLNTTIKFHAEFWDKDSLVIVHCNNVIIVNLNTGIKNHFQIKEELPPIHEVVVAHSRLFLIHKLSINYHSESSIHVYKIDQNLLHLIPVTTFKGFASRDSFIPEIRCGTIMGINQSSPYEIKVIDLKEISSESPKKRQRIVAPSPTVPDGRIRRRLF